MTAKKTLLVLFILMGITCNINVHASVVMNQQEIASLLIQKYNINGIKPDDLILIGQSQFAGEGDLNTDLEVDLINPNQLCQLLGYKHAVRIEMSPPKSSLLARLFRSYFLISISPASLSSDTFIIGNVRISGALHTTHEHRLNNSEIMRLYKMNFPKSMGSPSSVVQITCD